MEDQNLLQQIKQKGDERYSICKECPEFSSHSNNVGNVDALCLQKF